MKGLDRVILAAGIVCLLAVFVTGEPAPPLSITPGENFRANFSTTGSSLESEAGNVTQLVISGTSVTETWQGYYGNVTGVLTLQNANNNTFYEWQLFSSTGEVYASNTSTVNWTSVKCVNFTADGSQEINVTILETMFGLQDSSIDGFNETFNDTFDGSFFVGNILIDSADVCPNTNLFNHSGAQSVHFEEVLLTDTSTRSIIFAALTENDVNGFDNSSQDFEMLVADDGHNGDTDTTSYFFYVEMV